MIRITLYLFCICLFSGCATSDARESADDKIRPAAPSLLAEIDELFAGYDKGSTPGYAVGIVHKGELIHAKGYGSANLDYGIPITEQSVFNVASVAKQFTAACIAILIQEGRIGLDDPVRDFIEEFPLYEHEIRVKHLIYMTSGLKEYYTLERGANLNWESFFTVQEAIARSLKEPSLDYIPGEKWSYSNINYMLLAEIVHRVSGMSFSEFASKRIFNPLGMTQSHFNDDVTEVIPNRVIGYNHRDGGGFHHHNRIAPHYGGSGLFTSIEDLAKWDRSFYSHALGGPGLTELLLSTMKFSHKKSNDAFGLVWGKYKGLSTLWYEGGDLGFSSYMIRFPEPQFTVICLSNLGSGNARQWAIQVVDIFMQEN